MQMTSVQLYSFIFIPITIIYKPFYDLKELLLFINANNLFAYGESPRGIVANMLTYHIFISEFELQSRY